MVEICGHTIFTNNKPHQYFSCVTIVVRGSNGWNGLELDDPFWGKSLLGEKKSFSFPYLHGGVVAKYKNFWIKRG